MTIPARNVLNFIVLEQLDEEEDNLIRRNSLLDCVKKNRKPRERVNASLGTL